MNINGKFILVTLIITVFLLGLGYGIFGDSAKPVKYSKLKVRIIRQADSLLSTSIKESDRKEMLSAALHARQAMALYMRVDINAQSHFLK